MLAAKYEDFCSNISQYISVQISIFLLRKSALIRNQLNTTALFPNTYKPP